LTNVSRQIIPRARKEFPHLKVIFVFVPLALTVKRMRSRGREDRHSQEFEARLVRAQENPHFKDADLSIDNSGSIRESSHRLAGYIFSNTASVHELLST
jgi:ribose 1,5-bisphosphokinase PhnN